MGNAASSRADRIQAFNLLQDRCLTIRLLVELAEEQNEKIADLVSVCDQACDAMLDHQMSFTADERAMRFLRALDALQPVGVDEEAQP